MKNCRKKIGFTLLLLIVMGFSYAQDTLLTIEKIVQASENNYPGLLLYQSRIRSKEELAKGSRSLMPPTFAIGLDRFPYRWRDGSMNNEMDAEPREAAIMFMAEQMFVNPSKLNARQQYQSSLAGIEKNNFTWSKNRIVNEVSILYYQRYVAEKKLRLLNDADRLLELLIKTADGAYTYNQTSLSTSFKAKARREEIVNMKLMLESQVAESNIGINTLMGRDLNRPFSIDTLIVAGDPVIADSTELSKRSDIESMESQIKAMELKKKLMSASSKPDFGLRVTHMQMLDMPALWSVMGMISIPIAPWSSGMYKSEVSSMSYEIEAMKQERNSMLAMVRRMSAEKLLMLNNEKKQLENYNSMIIPAYEKNLQTALNAYKQNTSDYFVLLDAWEMLLMKKIEAADSELKVLRLFAEYEFVTGLIK